MVGSESALLRRFADAGAAVAFAEIPVVSVEETEHGTSLVWQVTFKEEVTVEGHTFHTGDTWEPDATLRQSGDSWMIDNF